MNVTENLFEFADGTDAATLDVLDDAVYFVLGGEHAHHVDPLAAAGFGCLARVGLKAVVEKEFDGKVVVLDALEERGAFDFASVVFEHLGGGRIFLLEAFKDVFTFNHGLDDVGIGKGEVEDVFARAEWAYVSFGPFVDVAPCAYGAQVDADRKSVV